MTRDDQNKEREALWNALLQWNKMFGIFRLHWRMPLQPPLCAEFELSEWFRDGYSGVVLQSTVIKGKITNEWHLIALLTPKGQLYELPSLDDLARFVGKSVIGGPYSNAAIQ